MLIPHADARRILWLKRFAPELFFAAVRSRGGGFLAAQPGKGKRA